MWTADLDKAQIVVIDTFAGTTFEGPCPCLHNINAPFVKRDEYQTLTAYADKAHIVAVDIFTVLLKVIALVRTSSRPLS